MASMIYHQLVYECLGLVHDFRPGLVVTKGLKRNKSFIIAE